MLKKPTNEIPVGVTTQTQTEEPIKVRNNAKPKNPTKKAQRSPKRASPKRSYDKPIVRKTVSKKQSVALGDDAFSKLLPDQTQINLKPKKKLLNKKKSLGQRSPKLSPKSADKLKPKIYKPNLSAANLPKTDAEKENVTPVSAILGKKRTSLKPKKGTRSSLQGVVSEGRKLKKEGTKEKKSVLKKIGDKTKISGNESEGKMKDLPRPLANAAANSLLMGKIRNQYAETRAKLLGNGFQPTDRFALLNAVSRIKKFDGGEDRNTFELVAQPKPKEAKPGMRKKQSPYMMFEEKRMNELKRYNSDLSVSQMKQIVVKEWQKSPDNPVNRYGRH